MTRVIISFFFLCVTFISFAQKTPLDHTVYDSWQHIRERMISNDGKWVAYTIDPQQGDNSLVIQSADTLHKLIIPRGYNAQITEDSRYLVFKIKSYFADIREAKIKKKKADEMPKDSFGIVELGSNSIWKTANVKAYKTPQKSSGWVAYQMEKKMDTPKSKAGDGGNGKKIADSLNHVIDSLEIIIQSLPKKKRNKKDGVGELDAIAYQLNQQFFYAEGDEPGGETGTDLVLRKLSTGEEKIFANVLEYYFSKKGGKLLIEQGKNPKDSNSVTTVVLHDLETGSNKLLSKGGNTFKNFSFTDDGSQVAYVAERSAQPKDLQKFYGLWHYREGMDSAMLIADKTSVGMRLGLTVSEFAGLDFSKSGNRLLFGVAAIQSPKDTTLVDFEHPKVDIWHYNDDYLQPMQLTPGRLRAAAQKSYLTVYDFGQATITQLASEELPDIIPTNEGDGDQFVGITDYGRRVEMQWTGNTKKDIYAINVNDGSKKLVKGNLQGVITPQYISPTGKYIMWYDSKAKNYFVWDGNATRNISSNVKFPLWNEENDTPSDPPPYGIMGWHEGDEAVYVYDKYDAWKLDSKGTNAPINVTKIGRDTKTSYRYRKVDVDEKFLKKEQPVYFSFLQQINKDAGFAEGKLDNIVSLKVIDQGPYMYSAIDKAAEANIFIYTKEDFQHSPDVYVKAEINAMAQKLSSINPQQSNYLWGTAELFKWKAYNGKDATGIIYKPENFDPKKKYPMITYFYEKLSDNLYDYKEPAPIRSAINVPFFVSRGYIIFMPDIEYKKGQPGQDAYDYIVSGARAVVKKGWADSTNLAIQGHSWGGYQAAQLATMTKLFKAVWAGAPVANMTSAYGGIRWESGMNRQFQYEKTQSRIGATLWDRPDLYIKNSPLFHLDKVTAPMVMMHNDGDGAVPWYQGIELFTGLRRLGKKVWMFNYNGQGHGLTQRQDMVDYQIRMQQFFDWILKGDKPAKWITEGVPAVDKGKDWGLEIVD